MKKRLIISLSAILGFITLCMIIFLIYTGNYYKSENVDQYLTSESLTINTNKNYIEFIPDEYDTQIIFYPGAKVEYEAYVPIVSKLASKGYYCLVLNMPFNIALFGQNRCEDFIDETKTTYLAGHSLGGVVASHYAYKNLDKIDGLILLASYSDKDLSKTNLDIISIYGSNDKIINREKYESYKKNLNQNYKELIIQGGIHSYFGYYGYQKNDGNPTITRTEQMDYTIDFIINNIK